MKDIGKMLSSLRRERKISQDDLAGKLGLTKQTISNYEKNKRRPDYETLEAICDILNVPVTFFMSSDERDQELRRVHESASASLTNVKYCLGVAMPSAVAGHANILQRYENLSNVGKELVLNALAFAEKHHSAEANPKKIKVYRPVLKPQIKKRNELEQNKGKQ